VAHRSKISPRTLFCFAFALIGCLSSPLGIRSLTKSPAPESEPLFPSTPLSETLSFHTLLPRSEFDHPDRLDPLDVAWNAMRILEPWEPAVSSKSTLDVSGGVDGLQARGFHHISKVVANEASTTWSVPFQVVLLHQACVFQS